jgi:hypothetical protein
MNGIKPVLRNPTNPLDLLNKISNAEKAAAEKLILEADARVGNGVLNTQLERDLLHHWIEGSGSSYQLDAQDLAAIQRHPNTKAVSDMIRSNSQSMSDVVQTVTLENGLQGYKASLDFGHQTGADNELDGSLGKADVYFNQKGDVIGVLDSYDFSNDNVFVDGINIVGANVGAKNFEVRGGVVEANAQANVPDGPSRLEAAGNVVERAASEAAEQAGNAWDNAKDGVQDLVDRLPPRYPRIPIPWG